MRICEKERERVSRREGEGGRDRQADKKTKGEIKRAELPLQQFIGGKDKRRSEVK